MVLDTSVTKQIYIEGCEVCCRPIKVRYTVWDGEVWKFGAGAIQGFLGCEKVSLGLRKLGMLSALWISWIVAAASAFAQSQSLSNEMLQVHNSIRRSLGVHPLTWSDGLAARAQEWAQSLVSRGQVAYPYLALLQRPTHLARQ